MNPELLRTGSGSGPQDVEPQQQNDRNSVIQDLSSPDAIQQTGRSDQSYTVIGWDVNDPENPHNWSFVKETRIYSCHRCQSNMTIVQKDLHSHGNMHARHQFNHGLGPPLHGHPPDH